MSATRLVSPRRRLTARCKSSVDSWPGSADPLEPDSEEGPSPVVAESAAAVVDDRFDERVGEDFAQAEGAIIGADKIDVAWLNARASDLAALRSAHVR